MHAWCTIEAQLRCGCGYLLWHSANSSASASTGCDRRFNRSNSLSLVMSLASARITWGSHCLWFPVSKTFTIYHYVEIHLGHGEIIQIFRLVFQRNSLWHHTELHRLCETWKNLCHMRKSCYLLPTNGVRNIRSALTCCLKEVIKPTVVLRRYTPSNQIKY